MHLVLLREPAPARGPRLLGQVHRSGYSLVTVHPAAPSMRTTPQSCFRTRGARGEDRWRLGQRGGRGPSINPTHGRQLGPQRPTALRLKRAAGIPTGLSCLWERIPLPQSPQVEEGAAQPPLPRMGLTPELGCGGLWPLCRSAGRLADLSAAWGCEPAPLFLKFVSQVSAGPTPRSPSAFSAAGHQRCIRERSPMTARGHRQATRLQARRSCADGSQ